MGPRDKQPMKQGKAIEGRADPLASLARSCLWFFLMFEEARVTRKGVTFSSFSFWWLCLLLSPAFEACLFFYVDAENFDGEEAGALFLLCARVHNIRSYNFFVFYSVIFGKYA